MKKKKETKVDFFDINGEERLEEVNHNELSEYIEDSPSISVNDIKKDFKIRFNRLPSTQELTRLIEVEKAKINR